MNIKILLFLLLFVLMPHGMLAQSDEDIRTYNQAESDYAIGRVEQAQKLLEENIGNFHGEMKLNAYRVLCLCCMELGKDEEAKRYIQNILSVNPFFSANDKDPQRFKDMLSAGNKETATISTASSKAEALSEVPVPVTLITSDMIQECGATNLKDVLLAYVPSMNNVDCNDDINIAMRGVFSNGQEKILIMLNGHRMNSYCTNIASPDFSISLEKIKQIEVLRGPASSLYGGVALTAVVNIITKQGRDVDGVFVKGGIGNFGQLRGDVLFGKHYADLDVFFWGSIYKREGQDFYVPAENTGMKKYGGDITVGGVGDKPSYDMGIVLTWKNRLKFMYDTHFSQTISPFTSSYGYSPYDRSQYMTFNGILPSYATCSHHIDLSYSHSFFDDAFHLQGTMTYDDNDMTHYQVVSDSSVPKASVMLGLPAILDSMFAASHGIFRYINGQESAIGAQVRGDFSYNRNVAGCEGLITFGAQFTHFKLDDMRYVIGLEHNITSLETNAIATIGKGHENSFNTFVQLKQRWYNLILNAGLRYDHHQHYNNQSVNEFSPRVALIYVRPKWNAKLSYSKSFVDSPYFYRKTNNYISDFMKTFSIASTTSKSDISLKSEYLHSFQFTLAGTNWVEGLDLELNGYYNRASNLIYTSILTHENAGTIKMVGAEFTGSYHRNRLSTNLTISWQHLLKSDIYNRDIDKSFNIPDVTINAVVGYSVSKRLHLHSHLGIESKQTNMSIDLMKQKLIKQEVDARALLDLGARYTFGKFELGANCNNVLDHRYYRGGIGTGLLPQLGRSFLAYMAVKF